MNRRAFLQMLLLAPILPAPEPLRLVTFGDSITSGYTSEHPYVYRVARGFGRTLVNLAEAGTHIARQRQVIEGALLDRNDVALLLTGYNDMRGGTPIEEYQRDLVAAMASLQRAGRVLLGNCLRMTPVGYALPSGNAGSDARVQEFNRTIARVYPGVIDICAAYDPQNVNADLVHPSNEGHAQIARAFLYSRIYLP
jgi:lysophospholipase L1-like esterase